MYCFGLFILALVAKHPFNTADGDKRVVVLRPKHYSLSLLRRVYILPLLCYFFYLLEIR